MKTLMLATVACMALHLASAQPKDGPKMPDPKGKGLPPTGRDLPTLPKGPGDMPDMDPCMPHPGGPFPGPFPGPHPGPHDPHMHGGPHDGPHGDGPFPGPFPGRKFGPGPKPADSPMHHGPHGPHPCGPALGPKPDLPVLPEGPLPGMPGKPGAEGAMKVGPGMPGMGVRPEDQPMMGGPMQPGK